MKRSAIILFVIALVSVVAIYSESVSADDESPTTEFVWGNYKFEIPQSTDQPTEVKLLLYMEPTDNPDERVEIPSTVEFAGNKYTVVEIGDGAFANCTKAKTVVIPNTVSSIGDSAFTSDCVESFEANSEYYFSDEEGVLFEGNRSLFRYPPARENTTYAVSNTTAQIADGAFSGATRLEKISIGPWVLRICDYAFRGCTGLKEVSFTGSVPGIIGMGAFFGCPSLTSIELPTELVSIGDMAFGECSSLESIKIPENVTYIGEGVFYKCSSLKNIDVDMYNTKYVVIEHALCAFDSQLRITSLIAFPAAYDVTEYTIPDWNKDETHKDPQHHYDVHIDDVQGYAFTMSNIKTLTLSPTMASIGMMAFAEMINLENIIIPKNISKIDYGAFTNCTALEKIDVGENTTSIGTLAFSGCKELKEIILHENLITIGDFAFKGCTSLASIEIPSSVTALGGYIFNNCTSLEYVTVYSKDVDAENTFMLINSKKTVTVESHSGALKHLGEWSDNVVFVNFEKRNFPMMNLVGIIVCLLILLVILNFLRRI